MQKEFVKRPEIHLIGISVQTDNATEMDAAKGKIPPSIQRYFSEQLASKIPDRMKPWTTLCAYGEYESDHNGKYTYFVGEEVAHNAVAPEGFVSHRIPAQRYVKFTNGPAPMPSVIRDVWFSIWKMTPKELGGERSFKTDFEVYDERATDHEKTVLDVYIGLS